MSRAEGGLSGDRARPAQSPQRGGFRLCGEGTASPLTVTPPRAPSRRAPPAGWEPQGDGGAARRVRGPKDAGGLSARSRVPGEAGAAWSWLRPSTAQSDGTPAEGGLRPSFPEQGAPCSLRAPAVPVNLAINY